MRCPTCGTENPTEAQFCYNCGTELAAAGVGVACPNCREHNLVGARFCNSCGQPLAVGCPNCGRHHEGDGLFCRWCQQFLSGPKGIKAAGIGRRVAAYFLDILLFFVTLIIGYIIWSLFAFSHGQTPGKKLLGIRVIRIDGRPSNWGWTFIREFFIKFILFEVVVDTVTVGLGSILDNLWAFWDRDRHALHDLIMKSIVVDDREFRSTTDGAPAAV